MEPEADVMSYAVSTTGRPCNSWQTEIEEGSAPLCRVVYYNVYEIPEEVLMGGLSFSLSNPLRVFWSCRHETVAPSEGNL